MARRTTEVTIPVTTAGTYKRDEGKTFIITEMDAESAEWWAIRAMSAAAQSNQDIPPNVIEYGWEAIAVAGMRMVLSANMEAVRPLLVEMMECVRIVTKELPEGRRMMPEDIEEIATRAFLRDEVFKLHANFSVRETVSRVIQTLAMGTAARSSDTPISPEPSQ